MRNSACIDVLIALTLVSVLKAPALSQTKWFKYEGNPVLDLGPPGAWDDEWIHIDRVIRQDSIYRMWYSGGWKTGRIGHAISRDGVTWKRDKSNPVLDVHSGSWERNVHRPYVIKAGSTYHMWYTGDDLSKFRIGYASSPDGIVWKKHPGNPVLDIGLPGSWDGGRVMMPSILGPDSSGGFKMWYQAAPGAKIGYATATDETSWTKYSRNPVFEDEDIVAYPRVMYDGRLYEMWYRVRWKSGPLRYATSPDGIHWTKSPENPVLLPGQEGTWDDVGLLAGDIIFDGNIYHMWYNGDDGSNKWRGGYAISPKGMSFDISSSNAYVKPKTEVVRVAWRVQDPNGLSFSAKIRAPGDFEMQPEEAYGLLQLRQVALIDLFDDGAHEDSLAGDGLYANSWVPTEEKLYFVDLRLRVQQKKDLRFEMNKAGVFTTIGPVTLESLSFLGDSIANPGDTILIKPVLTNRGSSAPARSVTASLSSTDPSISSIADFTSTYGNIAPGGAAAAIGYYRLHVNPYSPLETDVTINVTISSWGIPLWYDKFTLHVTPPWWRTTWAYIAYGLLVLGSFGGTLRYVETKKLKKRIELLEKERTLERERARISQDMHDEVGATLTEIAILSELAKKMPEEAQKHVQQISERSAEVIDSIGEIVWALNPKNDTLDNLIAYVRRYAVKYLSLAGINCKFVSPDDIPSMDLPTEVRRNLFLVIKEALHNIVKHSEATEVSVRVICIQDRLAISIVDNGRGFVMDERLASGNGLENMKKRIADIGGVYNIESASKKGTRVSIEVTPKIT